MGSGGTSTPTILPEATRRDAEVVDTVLRANGTTTLTTPRFNVDDSWSIAWRNEGHSLFSIQLIPAKVDSFGELLVSTVEPGRGESPMYLAGRYVLRIVGSHPWQVTVRDLAGRPELALPGIVDGDGPSCTSAFTTDGPWLLEWSKHGRQPFSVERIDLDEGVTYQLVHPTAAKAGCMTSPAKGRHVLHVVADGTWELRISAWDGGEVVCPQ